MVLISRRASVKGFVLHKTVISIRSKKVIQLWSKWVPAQQSHLLFTQEHEQWALDYSGRFFLFGALYRGGANSKKGRWVGINLLVGLIIFLLRLWLLTYCSMILNIREEILNRSKNLVDIIWWLLVINCSWSGPNVC